MAQGTIRIVRDAAPGSGGGASQTPTKTSGITISPDHSSSPTVQQQSGSGNATRRVKQSEVKRSTLSVEDRDGAENPQVTRSNVQPNRTTPAPATASQPNSSRVYNRKRNRYLAEPEAIQHAKFLLSATEMVGVTVAGPVGEMTEFERGMLTPPLQRILQRTPLGMVERATPLIDICFLVMGAGIYFNRISGGIKFPSRPQTKGVQEDTKAPQAVPVERTVQSTKPGDVDGIAVPIPSEISIHMNGAI